VRNTTAVLGFYQALSAKMANTNPNYAFDDIVGLIGPEDFLVKVQGADDLTGVTMQGAELLELSRFWYSEGMIAFPQRDFQNLLQQRFGALLLGSYSAKRELGGAILALGKQGGIIPQLLRPATVLSSGSTIVETWNPTANPAKGWTTSYFTINLNQNNSGGNAGKLQNLCTAMLFGLAEWSASPNIQEAQVLDASGAKYGIYSFPFTKVFDGTTLYLLPEAYYLKLNEQWTIDVNFVANAASFPVVVGVQWAKNQLATSE
jgi:hypothetical protein